MSLPEWAHWRSDGRALTIGIEEEIMLLDPISWSLAQAIDEVLPRLDPAFAARVHPETHAAAAELCTGVHRTVASATAELRELRASLQQTAEALELAVGSAGTHPFAIWRETTLSRGERYQMVYGSMRELAKREPTFALHVHVGVPRAQDAIEAVNRMRPHLPLLLALSANSPFWQGRDSGLASARTPVFQAFPRVGIPRRFASYEDYVSAVDLLIKLDAFPEPTFLWWDVRPQPGLGTVEVRIMDAQTQLPATAALVALVQCLVALELDRGHADERAAAPEVLVENRFLAARDGISAELIDPVAGRRVPVRETVAALVAACAPYARELGCEAELQSVEALVHEPSDERQLRIARRPGRLPGLVATLAHEFN
ncbi:MAG TPA: YbdK family carboxylate-amine ligase [Solirubrobacteraceae bacterium]|nr:YbdK family carboxylate-amine ligase [Solirubrobacteraceae bacterium]